MALNGGRDCSGDSKQVNPCNLGQCPGKQERYNIMSEKMMPCRI